MSDTLIEIVSPGIFTSIQDIPNTDQIHNGVPPGGPCDLIAASIGRSLFDSNVLCLECISVGPTIKFKARIQFAITGADMDATLNGASIPMYQIILAHQDDILHMSQAKNGYRSYLTLNGVGTTSNEQLTTRIDKGIKIEISPHVDSKAQPIPRKLRPTYTKEITLRYIPGPDFDKIAAETYSDLVSMVFRVSTNISRMGLKLENKITHLSETSIISSAVLPGTMQLTHDGIVIIMLQDAQTTGGYPRLGNIITAELPILGQAGPNTKVKFIPVDVYEAQNALSLYRENLTFFLK